MILVTGSNSLVVVIHTVLRHVSSILSQPQMAAAPEHGSMDKHDVQVCMPSSCVAANGMLQVTRIIWVHHQATAMRKWQACCKHLVTV